MSAGLKPYIWVQATIRRCDLEAIPAAISRRGDSDGGAILVKLQRAEGWSVHGQALIGGDEGETGWLRGIGPGPEADADAYIARQVKRDPDLWVIEIEDPKGRFTLV